MGRRHEGIIAALQEEESGPLRLGTAAALYGLSERVPVKQYLCRNFSLSMLYEAVEEGAGPRRPLLLRENVFAYLLGKRPSSPPGAFLRFIKPEEPLEEPLSGKKVIEELGTALSSLGKDGPATAVQLFGEVGSGRLFTLRHLAKRLNVTLALADGKALLRLSERALARAALEIASHARVNGFLPVLADFDLTAPDEETPVSVDCRGLFSGLHSCGVGLLFFLSKIAAAPDISRWYRLLHYEIKPPSPEEAAALWERAILAGGLPPAADLNFFHLGSLCRLTPGRIAEVASNAAYFAAARGEKAVAQEDVTRAVSMQSMGGFSSQCVRIETVYSFDDLILGEAVTGEVRSVIDRIRYAYQVNTQWGFDAKFAYGRGVSVLLYGLPGTGKTMCAQVLAKELGMDLYKVDLGALVSKYIGETEKNLSVVFREAQRGNAVLFFDEADALFAKRTSEQSSSNDKYANMETSHLLQKIEEFTGITVLASNLAGNFDKAFIRRIQFIIQIPFPDEAVRTRLWKNAFPETCPLAADVDFAMLAHMREDTSPSTIKSVALASAYRAAAEGAKAVTLRHVMLALQAELSKTGGALRTQELRSIGL